MVHAQESKPAAPIRALLITGGCCHDYEFQTKAIQLAAKDQGLQVEWNVVNRGGSGTKAEIDLYDDPNWAKNYDVVIHNECFADTNSPEYIRKITEAHRAGVNAVVIHCAMHTYRSAKIDDWREFLGVTSKRHDHQSHYAVRKAEPVHPIVSHIPEGYKTEMDELYIIEKTWPNTKPLAYSTSEADGKEYPVMWVNQFGKARVFGTTYGHSTETFKDDVFLTALAKGLKWAALGDDQL
jgi:type 1 glutamine amidotransferase